MRLLPVILLILLCSVSFADTVPFEKKSSGEPQLIQDGPHKEWCPVCGMKLRMFYRTSHALKLSGGVNKQYCSIRCMLQDYEGLQDIVKEILVVDAKTERLTNALNAYYVVGSSAPGTMTSVSKIAFADLSDAEDFRAQMGGEIMDYHSAAEAAKAGMDKDIAMTDMKRQKMMYPKGEKIFRSVCDQNIDPMDYNLINEMKSDIQKNNLCGKLSEKELQAVALYLWDVFRKENQSEDFISVPEDAKCPVCGMFVHKYPKWAAQIIYVSGGEEHSLYFDGVKDQMKFYLEPERWGDYKNIEISEMLVTDYYTSKALRADKAFYVTGADVYGPMGKELIPFSSSDDAETFMADHSGKEILRFHEITKEKVKILDE